MNIRMMSDTAQYSERIINHDFDMISTTLGGGAFPSDDLQIEWHTKHTTISHNHVGADDPIVDALSEKIADVQENEEELLDFTISLLFPLHSLLWGTDSI